MGPDGTRWVLSDGTMWNQVVPGGTKWCQVVPVGARWNQVVLSFDFIMEQCYLHLRWNFFLTCLPVLCELAL